MKAKYWDESTCSYLPVKVPDGCTTYEVDKESMVTCPGCGRRVMYGNCFTSKRFYTSDGLWAFSVCPVCHGKECGR